MESLVLANIRHRPVRVLTTALGISLGTVLVLLMVGLADGMLNDRNARETSTMAEILVRPQGTFSGGISSNLLSMPVADAATIAALPEVAAATPVGQYLQSTETGIGFRAIEAIDYPSYVAASGIRIVSGKPLESNDEVIVDEEFAENNKVRPGDSTRVLEKTYRIAGIYTPPVGARIKMTLAELQQIMSSEQRCSLVMVRCKPGVTPEQVAARISSQIAESQIIFTKDIPRLNAESLPILDQFLKVVIGVSVFISTIVILLAMYTAITERTREIGVLKSLGASNAFIVWNIEKEAITISLIGVAMGYVFALIARLLIVHFTSLKNIEIGIAWIAITAGIGILSALIGALYPALKAARQDPVQALSYE